MKKETRAIKDAKAINELKEWCKPLKLDLYDDGYKFIIALSGRFVFGAHYRRPWAFRTSSRSKAAAANEIINFIKNRRCISYGDEKTTEVEGGAKVYERREYRFNVPKCDTPDELTLMLALNGWTPPKRCSKKWKPERDIVVCDGITKIL